MGLCPAWNPEGVAQVIGQLAALVAAVTAALAAYRAASTSASTRSAVDAHDAQVRPMIAQASIKASAAAASAQATETLIRNGAATGGNGKPGVN